MAYLSEEIHPRGLGLSMGLYVGGTAFGGMFGRVGVGAVTEFASWRVALGIMGAVDLIAAIGFIALLPPSRNFERRLRLDPAHHLSAWHGHLRHSRLPFLFLIGCLLMGAFVTIYNYASFRMTVSPYNLSPSQISLIFVVYLFGIVASPVAGALADRLGRGPVVLGGITIAAVGVGMTSSQSLSEIISGVAALTIGFFAAHSVASAWVGNLAVAAKGHASSLYLFAYYAGSSIMGTVGGWFWAAGQWPAVAGFATALLALAFAAAFRVHSRFTTSEVRHDV
jgi:MFS transporter, YNFM family, putative membrane transport protein